MRIRTKLTHNIISTKQHQSLQKQHHPNKTTSQTEGTIQKIITKSDHSQLRDTQGKTYPVAPKSFREFVGGIGKIDIGVGIFQIGKSQMYCISQNKAKRKSTKPMQTEGSCNFSNKKLSNFCSPRKSRNRIKTCPVTKFRQRVDYGKEMMLLQNFHSKAYAIERKGQSVKLDKSSNKKVVSSFDQKLRQDYRPWSIFQKQTIDECNGLRYK